MNLILAFLLLVISVYFSSLLCDRTVFVESEINYRYFMKFSLKIFMKFSLKQNFMKFCIITALYNALVRFVEIQVVQQYDKLNLWNLSITSLPYRRYWHTQLLHYNRFTAPRTVSGTTRLSRYQKGKTREGKTNLDLLEQEIVSGSGISWAICKSAPRPRQVTTPASHYSRGR